MTGVLIRDEKAIPKTQTQGQHHVTSEVDTAVKQPLAKELQGFAANPQKLEGAAKGLPWNLQTQPRPADTLTSGFWLQNCERMIFCCLKPPSLWLFVTAALRSTDRQNHAWPGCSEGQKLKTGSVPLNRGPSVSVREPPDDGTLHGGHRG